MGNFIILTITLSVILVTVIILKVLHNNDDTFDTLLRRRTEREKAGVSGYSRINNDFNKNSEYSELLKTTEWKRRREGVFIARGA